VPACIRSLRDAGASVYVPVVRGHGNFGRNGDIDFIGQLEDDLADFVAVLRPLYPNASFSLIGFSSGGGFVLHAIATPDEKLFDRFIMISPTLRQKRAAHPPRYRRLGLGGEAAHYRAGDVEPPRHRLVQWASQRRFRDFAEGSESHQRLFVPARGHFGAPRDYLTALGRSRKLAALLVGGADELFYPDRFAPLFEPVRPDPRITIVPGIGHTGMTVAPAGIAAVRKTFLNLTTPATG
jgi:non-heme chloroperoxidase